MQASYRLGVGFESPIQVGAGSIPGRSLSGFMKRTALYYVGSVAKWASVDTCSLAAGHFGVTAHTILPWRQGAIIKPSVQVRFLSRGGAAVLFPCTCGT